MLCTGHMGNAITQRLHGFSDLADTEERVCNCHLHAATKENCCSPFNGI